MPVESKISKEQHSEIIARFAAGETIAQLARDYGVSDNAIRKRCTGRTAACTVKSEGKEQSYRENLNWALGAVGEFLRTGIRPRVCPNDAAWFLYCQALEEPKDFMAKVGQVELKSDNGESERVARASGQRSVAEIDEMLKELGAE